MLEEEELEYINRIKKTVMQKQQEIKEIKPQERTNINSKINLNKSFLMESEKKRPMNMSVVELKKNYRTPTKKTTKMSAVKLKTNHITPTKKTTEKKK